MISTNNLVNNILAMRQVLPQPRTTAPPSHHDRRHVGRSADAVARVAAARVAAGRVAPRVEAVRAAAARAAAASVGVARVGAALAVPGSPAAAPRPTLQRSPLRQTTRRIHPVESICMVSWLPQYHDMGIIGATHIAWRDRCGRVDLVRSL